MSSVPELQYNQFVQVVPKVQFKRLHACAKLPQKSNTERDALLLGDSGYDLTSVEEKVIPAHGDAVVDVGLQLAYITPGFWFRIEARSGLGFKHGIQPHFGIIDNPYRGILTVKLYNLTSYAYQVQPGDRIAQMVLFPVIIAEISETDSVQETERGGQRLGASGR